MMLFGFYKKLIKYFVNICSLATLVVGVGCEDTENLESAGDIALPSFEEEEQNFHPHDINSLDWDKLVCDPLGDGAEVSSGHGLVAELFYMDSGSQKIKAVDDILEYGNQAESKLFFTDLNIPTRKFDKGFFNPIGGFIENDLGEHLVENFALRFKAQLQLGPDDEDGDYELAILSDDGSRLMLTDEWGNEVVAVDNDGLHPTRMGCGEVISFSKGQIYDARLDYYQGPRFHVSLIPLWRKVDSQTIPEKECGKKGNGRYFDANKDSKPKNAYNNMLARGWKPIAAQNWRLPPSRIFNPCNEGTPAKISSFNYSINDDLSLTVSWRTDQLAASQVIVIDQRGERTLTLSDNILRTQHQIKLTDWSLAEIDAVQGISITPDLGKTLSRVLKVN